MKRLCKALSLLLALALVLTCPAMAVPEGASVTILYTNDCHAYLEQELTYSRIAAYRDSLDNALLVDAGDHIQGTAYGGMDQGETIVRLMNACGYDAATLGNHEFDYGMERCLELTAQAEFPYLSCNFFHLSDGQTDGTVLAPWTILEAGGVRVAFIGITTPESITKSTPAYFQDEQGRYCYSIAGGSDGQELYAAVQAAIDAVSSQADYVVALGHLGDAPSSQPWTSQDVIAHTAGLDAFIDGHSHSTTAMETLSDREGSPVVLTQTGSYFAALGELTLSPDGVTARLLSAGDLEAVQPKAQVQELEQAWIAQTQQLLGEKIAGSGIHFTINFPDSGQRAVRMAETNLGDFVTDAYYWFCREQAGLDVDVAILNGGGIRGEAQAGDWSYLTCKTINPFGNVLCAVEVTGQTILDMLEFGAQGVGATDPATGAPVENGSFLHTAGLTYDIDPSVADTIQTDEQGIWLAGPQAYRVTNVQVYDRALGMYQPLDLQQTYTLAGANYTLLNCGGGFAMLGQAKLVLDGVAEDYLALAAYAAAFADTDGDGYADLSSQASPLAAYSGYPLRYEAPGGAGRIQIPAPSAQPEDTGPVTYVVCPGDSLWAIAARYYGTGSSWEAIYAANRDAIQNPSLIRVGQVLLLPSAASQP